MMELICELLFYYIHSTDKIRLNENMFVGESISEHFSSSHQTTASLLESSPIPMCIERSTLVSSSVLPYSVTLQWRV